MMTAYNPKVSKAEEFISDEENPCNLVLCSKKTKTTTHSLMKFWTKPCPKENQNRLSLCRTHPSGSL